MFNAIMTRYTRILPTVKPGRNKRSQNNSVSTVDLKTCTRNGAGACKYWVNHIILHV